MRNRRGRKQVSSPIVPSLWEMTGKAKNILIPVMIFLLLLLLSTIFALFHSMSNRVISRVYANGVDISQLTIEEAYQRLNQELEERKKKHLLVKQGDYETSISLEQLEVTYSTQEAVNIAYKIGRNRNILRSNFEVIGNLLWGKHIELPIQMNEEQLEKMIEDICVKMPNSLVQSSYYIEEEQLIIIPGKAGAQVQKDALKETIKQAITAQIQGEEIETIIIPIEPKEPDAIDIDQIYAEVCKPAQDAMYQENKTWQKEVEGIEFAISKEQAKQALQEEKEEYVIPLRRVKPNITIEDLAKEHNFFPNLLAKFTTRYDESAANRTNNIKLSCEKIHETILMPGEVFSYNKIVGERTIKAGYKEAAVYMGGKVVDGIGGGICQVSSTLYNAVLLSNLEIVSRKNHYFMTSYVPASRDATVSYGTIDFQFKNTRKYPIKILCTAQNGICQVQIYGIEEEMEYQVEIQDRVTEVIPYTSQTILDPELPKGEKVIIQKGSNGYKSEAYRILKQNGVIISKTLLSKDSYHPLQEIIKEGTK